MQQFRYLIRKLAHQPLFSAASILTLALGIGANTAVFSVVNGILLKPLPFDEPEQLIGVWHTAPGLGFDLLNQSPALYFTYRERSELFEDTGMWNTTRVSVTGLQEPEQVIALVVTDGVLPLLRIRPQAGRLFSREDDLPDTPATVMLSHRYWQERFGGDSGVLGRSIDVDGVPREIIGVLPADLQFLDEDPDLALPQRFDRGAAFFGNFSYTGIARLKSGVTVAQANDEMSRMITMALDTFPMPPGFTRAMADDAGLGPNARPLKEDVGGDIGSVLWVLLGTVAIVLLVACANVANLFLVRAEGRHQEIAVRSALGSSRGQVARVLLGESLALGALGGAAGLALAAAGVRLLVAMAPAGLPRLDEIRIDPTVLAFTLSISLLAGLLFGLFPVLKLRGMSIVDGLREGGRGGSAGRERHRVRNTLVVSQVAMALVLLVGSGLMIRSFQALSNVDPGFRDPHEVLTIRLNIPPAEIEDPVEAARAHESILERLAAIPGVTSASMTSAVTMGGSQSNDPIFVEEFPPAADQLPPLRRFKHVAPDYFETMGNPIIAGRDFTWNEIQEMRHVVIVTENWVREHWDSPAAAIGKRIKAYPNSAWREIVGVVGNVHDNGVSQDPPKVIYWPMLQSDFFRPGPSTNRSMVYVLRSPRVGNGLLDDVRPAIWSVNSNLPLASIRALDDILARSMARTTFTLTMLGIAASTALLLGAIGIYGVTSYIVSQRTRELGVRMALGAQQQDVLGFVLRHGLVLAGLGVVVGLGMSFGVTRLMSALLYGVNPVDPMTYGLVAVAVTSTALLASYLPARRAARVDPIEALRE